MLEFWQMEVADGLDGVKQTVGIMVELTRNAVLDPIVRSTAIRLVRGAADPVQLTTRVRNFIARRLTRIMEYPEMLQPPDWMLHAMEHQAVMGDCDDAAMLAAALLLSLGFQTRFVVYQSEADATDLHVFTEVLVAGGDWLPVDPSIPAGAVPPPGWVQVLAEEV